MDVIISLLIIGFVLFLLLSMLFRAVTNNSIVRWFFGGLAGGAGAGLGWNWSQKRRQKQELEQYQRKLDIEYFHAQRMAALHGQRPDQGYDQTEEVQYLEVIDDSSGTDNGTTVTESNHGVRESRNNWHPDWK